MNKATIKKRKWLFKGAFSGMQSKKKLFRRAMQKAEYPVHSISCREGNTINAPVIGS